jgi:hypothetical protein
MSFDKQSRCKPDAAKQAATKTNSAWVRADAKHMAPKRGEAIKKKKTLSSKKQGDQEEKSRAERLPGGLQGSGLFQSRRHTMQGSEQTKLQPKTSDRTIRRCSRHRLRAWERTREREFFGERRMQ